jgi:hypothetical protein
MTTAAGLLRAGSACLLDTFGEGETRSLGLALGPAFFLLGFADSPNASKDGGKVLSESSSLLPVAAEPFPSGMRQKISDDHDQYYRQDSPSSLSWTVSGSEADPLAPLA